MNPNRASRAYICLECSLKLLYPRNAPRQRLSPKFEPSSSQPFSTTARLDTRIKPIYRPRENEQPSKPNDKRQRIRPRSWRTLLKNKTLGQNSSVIVLRDSENKTLREAVENGEQASDALTSEAMPSPEDIVLSMKNQEKLPGQEEVNKHIDTLRPYRSIEHSDAPVTVRKAEFESTLEALADGFNSTQLSRYINVQTGNAMLQKQAGNGSSHSQDLSRSSWRPIDNIGNRRGKKTLADIILRTCWNVEIREEIEALGTLDLKLSPQQFSILISGGKDSPLSNVGNTYQVKLEAIKAQSMVRITADKYKCEKVADAIANTVAEMHEIHFDLLPFVRHSRKGFEHVMSKINIDALGARTNSDIEIQRKSRKLILRSRNQGDAERCHRAILAAMDLPTRTVRQLVCNEDDNFSGFLWPQQDMARDGQTRPARYSSARNLGHVDTNPSRVKLRSERPVIGEAQKKNIEKLLNQHLQGPNVQYDAASTFGQLRTTITYSAEIGRVLHRSDTSLNTKHRPTELTKQATFTFAPGVTSLPQFLFYGPGESEIDVEDTLRLRLIPSPFGNHGLDSSKTFPVLDLVFKLDRSSQTFRLLSFHAQVDERAINVMMPDLANDVSFSSQTQMDMAEMLKEIQADAFVDAIIDSAVGYGKITPPASVKLRMPETVTQPVEGSNTNNIEYYVKTVAFAQQIHFDFEGVDLVYRWSNFAETGFDESQLFLTLRPQEVDKALDMTRLGEAVDQLLRILNRGLGRMGTLLDNVDKRARSLETQREEDTRRPALTAWQ